MSVSFAETGYHQFTYQSMCDKVLDEAMGLVVWAAGHKVAAVNLEINYHKPLPLHVPLALEARITQMDERKIFSTGEIKLPDGTVAVSGRGIYVVAPQLFEKVELEKKED